MVFQKNQFLCSWECTCGHHFKHNNRINPLQCWKNHLEARPATGLSRAKLACRCRLAGQVRSCKVSLGAVYIQRHAYFQLVFMTQNPFLKSKPFLYPRLFPAIFIFRRCILLRLFAKMSGGLEYFHKRGMNSVKHLWRKGKLFSTQFFGWNTSTESLWPVKTGRLPRSEFRGNDSDPCLWRLPPFKLIPFTSRWWDCYSILRRGNPSRLPAFFIYGSAGSKLLRLFTMSIPSTPFSYQQQGQFRTVQSRKHSSLASTAAPMFI